MRPQIPRPPPALPTGACADPNSPVTCFIAVSRPVCNAVSNVQMMQRKRMTFIAGGAQPAVAQGPALLVSAPHGLPVLLLGEVDILALFAFRR